MCVCMYNLLLIKDTKSFLARESHIAQYKKIPDKEIRIGVSSTYIKK